MKLEPVIQELRRRTGLDPATLGSGAVSKAVQARMQALHLAEPLAYAGRLADPAELETLVDEIVVPETWFLRGGKLFDVLAEHIGRVVHDRSAGAPFRVLSVPCSTGEEPFSLAIAVHERNIHESVEIEAIDLSPQQLERAEKGRYAEFSFRGTPPHFRQRHFRQVGEQWHLDPVIRALVRFRQGNLIDPLLGVGAAPFDLIFCRNLLIYLHAAARRQALETLDRLLSAEGLLCMGYAEPVHLWDRRFHPVEPPGYFLFTRTKAPPPDVRTAKPRSMPKPRAGVPASTRSKRSLTKPEGRPAEADTPAVAVDDLDVAREMANDGRLGEALERCQAYVNRSGPCADAFGLMGVIRLARQEWDEAQNCLRKALYLQPDHAEALTHLMLLAQRRGDESQAGALRRRLRRGSSGERS
jgi:chemotaxis protein methyltransferase WspC